MKNKLLIIEVNDFLFYDVQLSINHVISLVSYCKMSFIILSYVIHETLFTVNSHLFNNHKTVFYRFIYLSALFHTLILPPRLL